MTAANSLSVLCLSWLLIALSAEAQQPLPPAVRPVSGVRLYLGYGSTVPMNYVLLASSQVRDGDSPDDTGGLDGFDDGLWCQSAMNSSNIGSWSYPASDGNAAMVPANETDPLPFYMKLAIGQVGLAVESSLQGYSGYYRCEIPDENNNTQSQYAVLYPPALFNNYAGPTVEPTMQFSLLSSTDAAQPRFTLSFNVSNGPPTVVNCTVDGNDLAIAQEDVSREVTRALYNGTNQPDMTLVTVTTVGRQPGVYNCTVRVAGVENGSSNMISLGEASSTASISVAETPSNVTLNRTSLSSVVISWTAVQSLPGIEFEVFYQTAAVSSSKTTTNYSILLSNLSPLSTYSVFVVSFGVSGNVLPSSPSNTVSIQPALSFNVSSGGQPLAGSTDFTLVCSFALQSPATLSNSTWVDANNSSISSTSSVVQSQDDGSTTGTVTAQFSELVSADSGQYTCVLDVQDGNTVTTFRRSLDVTVQELRPTVQLLVEPNGAALVAGNNVSLVCNVTLSGGTINSVWNVSTTLARNGSTLSNAQFTANVSSLDSSYSTAVLLLSPLRMSHRGSYQCLVSATIAGVQSTANSSLTIIPQLPSPVITVSTNPANVPLHVGTFIDLVCSISISDGVDVPVNTAIQWERPNRTIISSDGDYEISSINQFSSSLRIKQLALDRDNGSNYHCSASATIDNPYQQANQSRSLSLTLNTFTSSDIMTNINVQSGTPTVGENFTIFCNITAPARLSSLPVVLWYRSQDNAAFFTEGEGMFENKVFIESVQQSPYVIARMIFVPLRTSDAIPYHCGVLFDNPFFFLQLSNDTGPIAVTVPPMQLSLSVVSPDPLYEMSQVTIHCTNALGDTIDTPKTVTGSWIGPDGTQLTDSSQISISTVTSIGENVYSTALTLNSVAVNDSGDYTCSMSVNFFDQPVTPVTSTKSVTINVTGPPSPPRNLQFNSTAFSLKVSWDRPSMPNGAIIQYMLTVTFNNGSDSQNIIIQSNGMETMSYVVERLQPYQLVGLELSVRTEAGISQEVSQQIYTDPIAAGAVSSINVRVVDVNNVTISWSPVRQEERNGILESYRVSVWVYGGVQLQSKSVSSNATLQASFTELVGERPYSVRVVALNNAPEEGMAAMQVFFTKEGIPSAPNDVTSQRLNGTHMLVRWNQISLNESRGFITNYTITYTRVGDPRRQATTMTVPSDLNQAVIGDLLPSNVYTVSVAASTTAGLGEFSTQATTPRFELSLFQVRAGDFDTCSRLNKIMVQAFIKSALVTAINDQCNDCGFTDVYISGEKLYCDCLLSMTVIYRANISNFANYTSDQLLSLLEIWIHGAPQVRNGVGQDIAFDAGFPVRLAVDDGVVCTSSSIAIPRPTGGGVPPTTADQLNLPAVISASVIGSLLIFILLVILFMFIFLIRLRHRGRSVPINSAMVLSNKQALEVSYDVPTKRVSLIEMKNYPSSLQPSDDLGAHIYENPDVDLNLDDFSKTPPPLYHNID